LLAELNIIIAISIWLDNFDECIMNKAIFSNDLSAQIYAVLILRWSCKHKTKSKMWPNSLPFSNFPK